MSWQSWTELWGSWMTAKPVWLTFVLAFVVGGLICVVGQLLIDGFKLTPAHTMAILVVTGVVLDGFHLYEPLIEFAGAGATVPVTSFGNALFHGAMNEYARDGWTGLLTGIFEVTSAGISSAIVFSFLAALLVKPIGR